jgi:glycosyl transferase family 25
MVVPTYLINLRRDGARLARMSAQLSRLGLDFERLDAIHGLDMPGWLQPYFFDADGKVASRLLPGEIGCYASHLVACAMIAQRGVPALVLEDDLEISDGFTDLLHSLSTLPAGWDIVRLSNPYKRACFKVSELTDRYSLVKFSRVPPSTGAYLLSPTGARKFLGWKMLRTLPVDQDLRRTWDCGLRTYGVFPQPVVADIGASTIDAMQMRSRQKLRKMFGVRDYLARSLHEICWIGPGAWARSRVNFGSRHKGAAAGSAMLSARTSF